MNKPIAPAHLSCPDCAPQPPLRNHWFWGKNIVPRDMIDEQAFFLEKMRLHEQRLHGTGIVCGLRLTQHANPACRDRLLVLEPGSAVDCCGHDILALEPDVVDLEDFENFRALRKAPDGKPHTLQLCIAYRECPTEEVPVLYDECACSDTRCAPNRILEAYGIDLLIDPPAPPPKPGFVSYRRRSTILVDDPASLAVDDAGKRLFVAKETAILEIDLATGALKGTRDLAAAIHGLAIARDGSRLDAVTDGAAEPVLVTLDIGGPVALGAAALRQGPLAGFDPAPPLFAEAADGGLALANAADGALALFAPGLPAPVAPTNAAFSVGAAVVGGAHDLVGKGLFFGRAGGDGVVRVALDATPLSAADVALTPAGSKLVALTLDSAAEPDRLVALDDGTAPRILLADPSSGAIEASVALDHPPVAMAITANGAIAHVLIRDAAGKSSVQSVDLKAMRAKAPRAAGAPFAVDDGAADLRVTADGQTVLVMAPDGIAILDAAGVDCGAPLKPGECPGCETPDCLVLATIANWQPGFALSDPAPGAPDPVADAAAKIARIDNDEGRTRLVSTQALAATLECLLTQPNGLAGPPGKDGKDGQDGKDGKDGKDGENGQDGAPGQDGQDGMPVDPTLAHLCAGNWTHRGQLPLDGLIVDRFGFGILVCFDKPVLGGFFDTVSFCVQFQSRVKDDFGDAPAWLLVEPKAIVPLRMESPCKLEIAGEADPADLCDGALYLFGNPSRLKKELEEVGSLKMRVRINGDLIPDEKRRGLDADHLPKIEQDGTPYWIRPPGGEPYASGDGVAGGLFESWFTLTRRG